jgi:hypothetical protein
MPFVSSFREPGIHALHVALGIACGGVHTEQEGAARLALLYVKCIVTAEKPSEPRPAVVVGSTASRQRKLL